MAPLTSTVVVCIKHSKEGADGEDIVVLSKLRHSCGWSLLAAGSYGRVKEWWSGWRWDTKESGPVRRYICAISRRHGLYGVEHAILTRRDQAGG